MNQQVSTASNALTDFMYVALVHLVILHDVLQVSHCRWTYMQWPFSFLPSHTCDKLNDQMQWTFGLPKHLKMRRHSIHSSCLHTSKAKLNHISRITLLFKMAPNQGSKNLYPRPDQIPPDRRLEVKAAQASQMLHW